MGREFQKRATLIGVRTPTRAFAAENACYGAAATYSEPTSQPSSRRNSRHEADSSECRCWYCPDNDRQNRQRRPRPHHHHPSLIQPNNKHRRAKPSWSPDAVRGVTTTVPFRPAKGDAGAKRTQGYARGRGAARLPPLRETIAKLTSFRRKPESRGAGAARRSLQEVPDPRLTPLQFPLADLGKGGGFCNALAPRGKCPKDKGGANGTVGGSAKVCECCSSTKLT